MTEPQHLGRTPRGERRTRTARPAPILLAGLLIGLFVGLLIVHGACMSSDWEGADPSASRAGEAQQVMGAHPAIGTAIGTAIGIGHDGQHEQHGRPGHHLPRQLPCCDHQAPHDRGALLSSSVLLLLGLAGLGLKGLRIRPPHPAGLLFLPRRSRPPRGTPRLALCVLRI